MTHLKEVFPAGLHTTLALHAHAFLRGPREPCHTEIRVHLCALRIHWIDCGKGQKERAQLHTLHQRLNHIRSFSSCFYLKVTHNTSKHFIMLPGNLTHDLGSVTRDLRSICLPIS